ncbi:putative fatty acyl-CoA reductase [Blattella germanica]|nr:putative fatty acyl-CoA reductase [Blattella germanica]
MFFEQLYIKIILASSLLRNQEIKPWSTHYCHRTTTITITKMKLTEIQEYYNGKSIFITGVTGFCGKMLLEKLLRSCPGIGNIYVLIRPKKGRDIQKRLQSIFQEPKKTFKNVNRKFPLNEATRAQREFSLMDYILNLVHNF